MKIHLVFLLFSLIIQTAKATHDSTRETSWWFAAKIGSAQSDVSEFQRWAAAEGVPGVTQFSRNSVFAFDILYNRNRVTYGLSSDFELRTFGQTEPYFFSFAFRAGYQWYKSERIELRTLGGLGVGYTLVRFENEIPTSLQNIASGYSDPYARASSLIGRLEILASYSFLNRPSRNNPSVKPLLFVNAGAQPVLKHGLWNFGDNEVAIDGNQFAGQRIDMPKFYKGNWFIAVGIAASVSIDKKD
jgi:hypothetical protein